MKMKWRGKEYDLAPYEAHECNSFNIRVHPQNKTVRLGFTRIGQQGIEYASILELDATIATELVADLADGLLKLGVPGAIFRPPDSTPH